MIDPPSTLAESADGAIVLTGMPGVGKSAVGHEVARRLGRTFVDSDAWIEERAGETIAAIVERAGEAAFRALERAAIAEIAASPAFRSAVIATGGFAIADPESRRALEAIGTLVLLVAPAEVIAERAAAAAGKRPLLRSLDEAAIARLWAERRAVYGSVAWRVETGEVDVAGAADRVIDLVGALRGAGLGAAAVGDRPSDDGSDGDHPARVDATPREPGETSRALALSIASASGDECALLVAPGLLDVLGAVLAARGIGARTGGGLAIVTDTTVGPLYAERVRRGLVAAGMDPTLHTMDVGEAAKSPETARRLAEELAAAGHGRDLTLVALGGGVVTDTAGFVAATFMRGVRFVHVPTTLLAMVDAAIGGKTGVNLDAGKNLLGAFHDPMLVAADPRALATLPASTLRAGLAEVVKAALIDDPALLDLLARGLPADPDGWGALVARAAGIKARIVERDPRERKGGPRERLNLGHTFAHAIEHVSDHLVPHGEAVAIGLVLAARLSEALGLARPGLADDVSGHLQALGLPVRLPDSTGSVDALLGAMGADKKRRGGRLRFVLIRAPGDVVTGVEVPERTLVGVLEGG